MSSWQSESRNDAAIGVAIGSAVIAFMLIAVGIVLAAADLWNATQETTVTVVLPLALAGLGFAGIALGAAIFGSARGSRRGR